MCKSIFALVHIIVLSTLHLVPLVALQNAEILGRQILAITHTASITAYEHKK